VAQVLRVHAKTVSGWWAAYSRVGAALFEPGRRGRRPGDQRCLTGQQERDLQRLITVRLPEELGLPSVLWTRSAVGELIERRYAIRLAVRTLGEYLRRWGYSPQKPQKRAEEQGDPSMQIWLDETYPEIISGARRAGAQLFWGDQPLVKGELTVAPAAWFSDHKAAPLQSATPVTLSLMRAVTNRGGVRFLVFKGGITSALLIQFCGRIIFATEGRPVHLILDQLPVHRTQAFLRWISGHRHHFTVSFLPAVGA
jgi:transposase